MIIAYVGHSKRFQGRPFVGEVKVYNEWTGRTIYHHSTGIYRATMIQAVRDAEKLAKGIINRQERNSK